jgi:hypothetical protein
MDELLLHATMHEVSCTFLELVTFGTPSNRHQVPLNYSDPTGDDTFVAMVRKPATDLDDYRGPVLFNPGGVSLD